MAMKVDGEDHPYGGEGGVGCAMTQGLCPLAYDEDMQKQFPPVKIAGQLFFKSPIDASTLKGVLKTRLLAIPRFRCVMKKNGNNQVCLKAIPISDISMDYHVVDMTASPMSREQVDAFLSRVHSNDQTGPGGPWFDYSRPPWRFVLIKMNDGRTLMVPLILHVLVDGVAAVAALMSILDDGPSDRSLQAPKVKRSVLPPVSAMGKMQSFFTGIKEALLPAAVPADPMNCLKEPDHRNPGKMKASAMADKVSLDEMKRIKGYFPGSTVNDIMLATMTMTLQGYFAEVGEESKTITGNFPVNMRPPSEDVLENSIGNMFAPASYRLPMTETDPVELILEVKRRIDMLKHSPQPKIASSLFEMVLPKMIADGKGKEVWDMLLDAYGKVTIMFSNVPGPSAEVNLCGQPVDDMMFYVYAGIGCYLGIISYNGGVSLGVVTNSALVPDPSQIAKHWKPSFETLMNAVDNHAASLTDTPRVGCC